MVQIEAEVCVAKNAIAASNSFDATLSEQTMTIRSGVLVKLVTSSLTGHILIHVLYIIVLKNG